MNHHSATLNGGRCSQDLIDDIMKKETILLIDDDERVLSMLAKSLEESYQVLVATNGMAAE